MAVFVDLLAALCRYIYNERGIPFDCQELLGEVTSLTNSFLNSHNTGSTHSAS